MGVGPHAHERMLTEGREPALPTARGAQPPALLIRLKQLDTDIESSRRRIAELPSVQLALDARLAEQQAAVAAMKERLAQSQTTRRATEGEVASLQIRLSKYKGQLMEVKTNKEYQAMQKEIATAEEAVRSQEDRILEQ